MTEAENLRLAGSMIEEAKRVKETRFPIFLDAWNAIMLVSICQLALRHPQLPPTSAEFARRLIDGIIDQFIECNLEAFAEAARLGDDPRHDEPGPRGV